MAKSTTKKTAATRSRATPARRKPAASRPRVRAQTETVGTMDQILSMAEHSGGALARTVEERPLMMLAGAGLIGLIAAAVFSSTR